MKASYDKIELDKYRNIVLTATTFLQQDDHVAYLSICQQLLAMGMLSRVKASPVIFTLLKSFVLAIVISKQIWICKIIQQDFLLKLPIF